MTTTTTTTTTTYNHELEIGAMKVVDLRRALRERHLSAAGVKKVLQQRLREAVELELQEKEEEEEESMVEQPEENTKSPVVEKNVEILEDDNDSDKQQENNHLNNDAAVESELEAVVDDNNKPKKEEAPPSSPVIDQEKTTKEQEEIVDPAGEESSHGTERISSSGPEEEPSEECDGDSTHNDNFANSMELSSVEERVLVAEVSDTAAVVTTTDTAMEDCLEETPKVDDDDEPIAEAVVVDNVVLGESTNNGVLAETTPDEEEFFDATDSQMEVLDSKEKNDDVSEKMIQEVIEDFTNLDSEFIDVIDLKAQDAEELICVPIEAPSSPAKDAVANAISSTETTTAVVETQSFIGDIEESPSKATATTGISLIKDNATTKQEESTAEKASCVNIGNEERTTATTETPNPPPTLNEAFKKTVSRIPKPSVKASKIPKPSFSRKSVPTFVPKSINTATTANATTSVPGSKASKAPNESNRLKKSVLTQSRPSLGGSKRISTHSNVIKPETSNKSRPLKTVPKLSRAPLTAKTNQRRVLSQDNKRQSMVSVAKKSTTFKARPIIAPKVPILPRATDPSSTATNANAHLHWTKRAPAPSDHQVKTHNRQAYYWCRKCELWNTAHGTKQHFGPGISATNNIAGGKKQQHSVSAA